MDSEGRARAALNARAANPTDRVDLLGGDRKVRAQSRGDAKQRITPARRRRQLSCAGYCVTHIFVTRGSPPVFVTFIKSLILRDTGRSET